MIANRRTMVKSRAPKRRNIALLVWTSAAMVLIVLILRLVLRPIPLDIQAVRLTEGIYSGNADLVASFVPDYELKRMGVRRSQIRDCLAQVVLPRFRRARFLGIDRHYLQRGGSSGVAGYRIQLADNRVLELNTLTEASDEGAICLFSVILHNSWNVDAMNGRKAVSMSTLDILVEHLRADIPTLAKYGITSLASDDESKPASSLEFVLARYKRLRADPDIVSKTERTFPTPGRG